MNKVTPNEFRTQLYKKYKDIKNFINYEQKCSIEDSIYQEYQEYIYTQGISINFHIGIEDGTIIEYMQTIDDQVKFLGLCSDEYEKIYFKYR